MKKIAVAGIVLAVLALAGYLWARSVFTHDNVRAALAAQISSALGQPVAIEGIGATIFPRVTVKLDGVSIGQPARITARTLRLGTDFRALLSRQIVHGSVRLDGARVELPLPPLGTSTSPSATASAAPVEIVSIDEIVLNGVELVSGGRTLKGDIEAVPKGAGVTLRKVSLEAEDASFSATGEISNLAGPVGDITIDAKELNFTRLLDFLAAFSSGAGVAPPSSPPRGPKPAPTDLAVTLNADRASLGSMALQKLTGRARVTREGVTIDPIGFGIFGGAFKGAMTVTAADGLAFRFNADVSGVDAAALAAFAGSPDTITGRLSGRLELGGQSAGAAGLLEATRGTARIEVRDGVIKNLGLVKAIVLATSGRSGAPSGRAAQGDERFSRLGATLRIASNTAQTNDLRLESPDVLMNAAGSARLDGRAINLSGKVQLSEELTRQSGRDLVRYTQEQGKVTVPVTVTGSAQAPSVRVDIGSLAGRAVENAAKDQLNKTLGKLLKR